MSVESIRRNLMKQATAQGREEQMELLIEWRLAYISHLAGDTVSGLKAFMQDHGHEPREIREIRLMGGKTERAARPVFVRPSTNILS